MRLLMLTARLHTRVNRLPVYDVLIWARDFVRADFVEDYKLKTIISYVSPEESYGYHHSDEDVRATVALMNKFMPMYMNYEPVQDRYDMKLEYAYYFETPQKYLKKKNSHLNARINLKLAEGEKGDIFYDLRRKTWAAKKTASAYRLLNRVRMENIEAQFLQRYSYPYGCCAIEDAAKRMQKESRERYKNDNK